MLVLYINNEIIGYSFNSRYITENLVLLYQLALRPRAHATLQQIVIINSLARIHEFTRLRITWCF